MQHPDRRLPGGRNARPPPGRRRSWSRIFGQPVRVKARIYTVGGLSAHADQSVLLGWLRGFHKPPENTFVVHGEANAAADFVSAIESQLEWKNVHRSQRGETFTL
jgi:metallo-beta-lactamase family protein